MKKLMILALALMVSAGAVAQEQKEEKKKGGGLMRALRKGVESATGLDVSKEALFVYPEIGKWKMSVVSCTGDPETGAVDIKLAITTLFSSPRLTGARVLIVEAGVPGGAELGLERYSADPLWDLVPNKPVEVPLNRVLGVPASAKTINLKFYVENNLPNYTFELRDCPIEWITPEKVEQ